MKNKLLALKQLLFASEWLIITNQGFNGSYKEISNHELIKDLYESCKKYGETK